MATKAIGMKFNDFKYLLNHNALSSSSEKDSIETTISASVFRMKSNKTPLETQGRIVQNGSGVGLYLCFRFSLRNINLSIYSIQFCYTGCNFYIIIISILHFF
jgi:hypothetical protein